MGAKRPLRADQELGRALKFAYKAHRGQERDGESPLPYLSHPVDVLCRLRYVAGIKDSTMLCAALLHDVLEETRATAKDIEAEFGTDVRRLVEAMTRREPLPETTAGLKEAQVWRLRNDMLLREIAEMPDKAKTLKLADRCSNLEAAIATRSGEKLSRYLWQSACILAMIDRKVCPPLWDQIAAMLERHPLPKGWRSPK